MTLISDMHMRFIACIAIVALSSAGLCAICLAAPEDPAKLLKHLLKQSAQAHERLQDCRYRVVDREWSTEKNSYLVREARVVHKGRESFVDGVFPFVQVDEVGRRSEKEQRVRSVVNEEFVAQYRSEGSSAVQIDNELSKRPSDRGAAVIRLYRPLNLANFASGDGARTLEELRALLDARAPWTVKGPDPNGLFTVQVSFLSPERGVAYEYVLDSSKGFFTVNARAFRQSGTLAGEHTVELAQTNKGEWYPRRVQIKHETNGVLQIKRDAEITNFEFAPSVSDDQFALSALGLEDGATLVHERRDGRPVGYVLRNGQLQRGSERALASGVRSDKAVFSAEGDSRSPLATDARTRTRTTLTVAGLACLIAIAIGVWIRARRAAQS